MNVWKLTAAKTLVKTTEENPLPAQGKRKIRVTKVMVDSEDVSVFSGALRVKYPRVIGRFAVGVVADEGDDFFKKGSRVLLHAILPEEMNGTEKLDFSANGPRICGIDTDGYLRDFVYADKNDITLLPEAVNDEKALLIQHVALAKAAVEALSPQKGDHIAVIGGNILGLLICQLLIYQQVSPIFIDSRADRIELARKCGIYYTAAADETLIDSLATVTGGRLADGVVFATGADADAALPFAVCAREKNIVFCGKYEENVKLELSPALRKQLTLHAISDGTDYIETAINLIANKAAELSVFRMNLMPADKLPAFFKNAADGAVSPVNEINVANLL